MNEAQHRAANLDPIEREAVAWVQRLLSGAVTEDDAEALKRWCAESPAKAAAFAKASRLWSDIGPATQGESHEKEISDLVAALRARRKLTRRTVLGGTMAAAAAGVAYTLVQPPLGLWPSLSELRADYRTATGEQRQITLADQVAVTLNTQTSISLNQSEGGANGIELIGGEASFTTVASGTRPLVVVAAGGRTMGPNAHFSVRYLVREARQSVCVTCLDGQIHTELGNESRELGKGQQVEYDDRGLGRVASVDPEIAAPWLQGIVIFRATPLSDVVEEINRYRPGRIVLMNAALAQRPVSGRFRIDRMNDILVRLQQAFDARVRTFPGGIVLLS
jgi:transmembrane sensor